MRFKTAASPGMRNHAKNWPLSLYYQQNGYEKCTVCLLDDYKFK